MKDFTLIDWLPINDKFIHIAYVFNKNKRTRYIDGVKK